jgi:GNAT superfamily N-acetyltransferase
VAAVAFAEEEEGQRRHFDEMCAGSDDNQVYVALTDGEIAGFVTVMLDRKRALGEIGLNAVDPAYASRGIGTAMYEFALERMREDGMKAATVGTGADDSHAPARAAYSKAGFDRAIPGVHLYREL